MVLPVLSQIERNLSVTTSDTLNKCVNLDNDAKSLLTKRDNAYMKLIERLSLYEVAIDEFFNLDYVMTSHHCKWMKVFQETLQSPYNSQPHTAPEVTLNQLQMHS